MFSTFKIQNIFQLDRICGQSHLWRRTNEIVELWNENKISLRFACESDGRPLEFVVIENYIFVRPYARAALVA